MMQPNPYWRGTARAAWHLTAICFAGPGPRARRSPTALLPHNVAAGRFRWKLNHPGNGSGYLRSTRPDPLHIELAEPFAEPADLWPNSDSLNGH